MLSSIILDNTDIIVGLQVQVNSFVYIASPLFH